MLPCVDVPVLVGTAKVGHVITGGEFSIDGGVAVHIGTPSFADVVQPVMAAVQATAPAVTAAVLRRRLRPKGRSITTLLQRQRRSALIMEFAPSACVAEYDGEVTSNGMNL